MHPLKTSIKTSNWRSLALLAFSLICSACAETGSAVQGAVELEKGYFLSTKLWQRPEIPVCWENPAESNPSDRQVVRDIIADTWERHSPLSFTGWGSCSANARGIRIRVEDSNPFVRGLGKQIDGTPNGMILNERFVAWSPFCSSSESTRVKCIQFIAIHEFGHAIGIAHEQNRDDTPQSCTDAPQGSDGDVVVGA